MRGGTFARASGVGSSLMIAVWSMLGLTGGGCGSESPHVECTCVDPSLRLHVPPERAAAVIAVVPSEPACAGSTVSCAEAAPEGTACVTYAIRATAQGNCHVDVDFSSGPARFSADVRLLPGGCCSGFYATPASAADIDVPSASNDAGGTE